MKLGIIGAGKMGSSIGLGAIKKGVFAKEDVYFAELYEPRAEELKKENYNVLTNSLLFQECDIVILAIKPQQFEGLLEELSKVEKHARTVVSIAAGIPVSYIKEYLKDINCVRVMPNTPALIGEGTIAISYEEKNEIVEHIFQSIGNVITITEDMMNAVIPLNGSFPAYGYYFARSFIKAGVDYGFDYETAKMLVASSMIGTAKMILEANKDLDTLINDVCSKGGTTIEGIKVFEEKNFDDIIHECYEKCVKRAIELGK